MFNLANLAAAKLKLAESSLDLEWVFHDGAREDDLDRCENAVGAPLPPDVRALLRRSNGVALYQHPRPRIAPNAGNNLFFLSTEQIVAQTDFGRALLREIEAPQPEAYVFLVDVQDGDYIVLDVRPDRNYLIEGNHEEILEWSHARQVARTLTEFSDAVVASILSGGTARYWNEPPFV